MNSVAVNQDLTAYGVEVRDQNAANGFRAAYYNSDLDAAEFSISRQALLDAGYDPGPVDGFMGDKTAQALKFFQEDF